MSDHIQQQGPGSTEPSGVTNSAGSSSLQTDQPDILPETIDESASEIAMAEQLDAYLVSLRAGTPPANEPEVHGESKALRPVLDELHELSRFLNTTLDEKTCDDLVVQATVNRDRIGKFEIRQSLGRGGQASAYLAFDPDLRRHVVIKLYHGARDPTEQEAVLNEGRALARVRSQFVAQCFGADRFEGVPYLVMEYVPGKTLAELRRTQKLATQRAMELVGQVSEGLAAIHACGLLHRDIKPSNIIVGDDGNPRLIDFGLATHLGSEALERISGTLPYMAPEQARGEVERIDPRTDLFGLGAVLYELLTKRPPFRAPNRDELLRAAQAGDVVPPRERDPQILQAVNDLCMRCLAKDPAQRFASARELGEAIQQWRRRQRWKGLNLIVGFGSRKFRIFIGTIAALLLLAPLAWWTLMPDPLTHYHHSMVASAPSPNDGPPGATASAKPLAVRPQPDHHPDGRPLRRDFELTVELIGSQHGADGEVVLTVGDVISIRVEADRDCYIGVWSVESDTVVQLLPNIAESNHRLRASQPREIPGVPDVPGQEMQIRVAASKGGEYVHVVASTQPLPPSEGERLGPYVIITKERLRGLVLEAARPRDDKPLAVSEIIIPYEVRPKQTQKD